jgi:hypothetical protein
MLAAATTTEYVSARKIFNSLYFGGEDRVMKLDTRDVGLCSASETLLIVHAR